MSRHLWYEAVVEFARVACRLEEPQRSLWWGKYVAGEVERGHGYDDNRLMFTYEEGTDLHVREVTVLEEDYGSGPYSIYLDDGRIYLDLRGSGKVTPPKE